MTPIAKAFAYSRDYVEFLIYAAKHHIRAEVRRIATSTKNGSYKALVGPITQIVYDTTGRKERRTQAEAR